MPPPLVEPFHSLDDLDKLLILLDFGHLIPAEEEPGFLETGRKPLFQAFLDSFTFETHTFRFPEENLRVIFGLPARRLADFLERVDLGELS